MDIIIIEDTILYHNDKANQHSQACKHIYEVWHALIDEITHEPNRHTKKWLRLKAQQAFCCNLYHSSMRNYHVKMVEYWKESVVSEEEDGYVVVNALPDKPSLRDFDL